MYLHSCVSVHAKAGDYELSVNLLPVKLAAKLKLGLDQSTYYDFKNWFERDGGLKQEGG